MTGKRLRKLLPGLAFGMFLSMPALAQIGGPVDAGLAQLASQIVAKSQATGKTAIAVLPFPNADGTCSVLSNFIADELIQSLFSVPGSTLEIVERAQLEVLIDELKLGTSGLLNPETTRRLGTQSGVGALTVGTITVIGDTVRINARLIATDSGKAISAAAVDVPKVAAVSELLKQPITTGPTCTPRKIGSGNQLPQGEQVARAGQSEQPSPPSPSSPKPSTGQAADHTTRWAGVFATLDRFSLANNILTLEMRFTNRATERIIIHPNPNEFRLVDESSGQSWKPELTSGLEFFTIEPKQSVKSWSKFRFDQPPPETLTLIGGGLDSPWEMLRPN